MQHEFDAPGHDHHGGPTEDPAGGHHDRSGDPHHWPPDSLQDHHPGPIGHPDDDPAASFHPGGPDTDPGGTGGFEPPATTGVPPLEPEWTGPHSPPSGEHHEVRFGGYSGSYAGVDNCWYSSDGYVYDQAGNRIGTH